MEKDGSQCKAPPDPGLMIPCGGAPSKLPKQEVKITPVPVQTTTRRGSASLQKSGCSTKFLSSAHVDNHSDDVEDVYKIKRKEFEALNLTPEEKLQFKPLLKEQIADQDLDILGEFGRSVDLYKPHQEQLIDTPHSFADSSISRQNAESNPSPTSHASPVNELRPPNGIARGKKRSFRQKDPGARSVKEFCGQFRLGDPEKLRQICDSVCSLIKQGPLKHLLKVWIRKVEPHKQRVYPYKKWKEAEKTNGVDDKNLKPRWWPTHVDHREPDHLGKDGRHKLFYSIIIYVLKNENRKLGKNMLEEFSRTPEMKEIENDTAERKDFRQKLLKKFLDIAIMVSEVWCGERDHEDTIEVKFLNLAAPPRKVTKSKRPRLANLVSDDPSLSTDTNGLFQNPNSATSRVDYQAGPGLCPSLYATPSMPPASILVPEMGIGLADMQPLYGQQTLPRAAFEDMQTWSMMQTISPQHKDIEDPATHSFSTTSSFGGPSYETQGIEIQGQPLHSPKIYEEADNSHALFGTDPPLASALEPTIFLGSDLKVVGFPFQGQDTAWPPN